MSNESFGRAVAVHTTGVVIGYSLIGLAVTLGVGAAILGSLSAAWSELISILIALWRGLTHSYPVPTWTFIPAISALYVIKDWAPGRAAESAPRIPALGSFMLDPKTSQLSQLEDLIIRMLAERDGQWVHVVDIPPHLRASNLVIEAALEGLARKDLIEPHQGRFGEPMVGLSRAGRTLAIEEEYVPRWQPPE